MEKFKITYATGDGSVGIHEDEGERIMIENRHAFISEETTHYNITDAETGMRMARESDRELAILMASERVKNLPQSIQENKEFLINKGIELPVNTIQ